MFNLTLFVAFSNLALAEVSFQTLYQQSALKHAVSPLSSTLVIKRLSDGQLWDSNKQRSRTPFSPASTSKIPHTLIAIESGIADADSLFKWDGIKRFHAPWNQDQTLQSAFEVSAVWVFQDITQSLGSGVMSEWLQRLDYGNALVGSDEDLTTYWLRGPLKISALEQVSFLEKLVLQKLELSPSTYAKALPLMIRQQTNSYTLYGKTGWMSHPTETDIGWFVGWVESATNVWIFAYNMDMLTPELRFKRTSVVTDVLTQLGATPTNAAN